MTTEQKTQFIREKCIEANPEIVELKFGCEVKIYQDGFYFGDKSKLGTKRARLNSDKYNRNDIKEIIGRKINLEDVLMALKENRKLNIHVDVEGYFTSEHELGKVIGRWHLGKPFTEQSEELKNFVYEILKDE